MIDRAGIARLIPHAGRMVLLDGVVGWTGTAIACVSRSHLEPAHPLAGEAGLAAIHAVEYLAQAAAVHGALVHDGEPAPRRLLAAVRDVHLATGRLDRLEAPLEVRIERQGGDGHGVVYAGSVHAGALLVASARLTLVASPGEAA